MAHFAEINTADNNTVIRVRVLNNFWTTDDSGGESEERGKARLKEFFGGEWKQTSYNTRGGNHKLGGTPFRKNYAGRGYTYDEARDAFIPPKPFDSWVLDEDTCNWGAPVPRPDDAGPDKRYRWNEDEQKWELVE